MYRSQVNVDVDDGVDVYIEVNIDVDVYVVVNIDVNVFVEVNIDVDDDVPQHPVHRQGRHS